VNRYFLYVGYDGANYCGWQFQPNGVSVQQVIQSALTTLCRQPISIVGAGRTDAGVHARRMVAHFDTDSPLDNPLLFTNRLNRLLPNDIAIEQIVPVRPDAHARFSALSRTYHYYVSTRKVPFARRYTYLLHHPLDFVAMNEAARLLYDYADFACFSKSHTDVRTHLCRIACAEWRRQNDEQWTFVITADRFLRNMVRAIVGTLFDIGRGKLTKENFRAVIESKDRSKAGMSAPAYALFLTDITYPPDLFLPPPPII